MQRLLKQKQVRKWVSFKRTKKAQKIVLAFEEVIFYNYCGLQLSILLTESSIVYFLRITSIPMQFFLSRWIV